MKPQLVLALKILLVCTVCAGLAAGVILLLKRVFGA
jgi:hypothetical protein